MQAHEQPQHARAAPRSAAPANNPTTNPERTNNSRDEPPRRSRSSVDLASYTVKNGSQPSSSAAARPDVTADEGPDKDKDRMRLNQIISHFHTKAALAICSSRASLPQVKLASGEAKQDRWFNISLDETDVLQDSLYDWKRLDQADNPAPPLVLEIYLDTSNLNSSQALVLMDDSGKRWDVGDALASSAQSSPRPARHGARYCEVILERWTIQLGQSKGFTPEQLNELLPNIYKKGVVFFRSLYTFLRMMPAWKLYRKLNRQHGNHQAFRLKYRIKHGHITSRTRKDPLYTPLCASEHRSGKPIERHDFPPILTPPGPLCCSLEYRKNCTFTVTDAESLLSSRFLGLEQDIPPPPVGRSLPSSGTDQARERYSRAVAVEGPATARAPPRGLLGAYGSLGTFHTTDKAGSPVSELRQRAEQADENDAATEPMRRVNSRESAGSRRVSISLRDNPPFKAGSLASSPRPSPRPLPSPGTSLGRYEGSILKQRGTPSSDGLSRVSSATRPQQLRMSPSIPNETAVASSGSTSPRPGPVRYSSSFAHRHKRLASHGSKTADSNASSGRGSSSSKEKSGQLYEGLPAEAYGGGKSDDDDIAAFISQIETAKDLKAFRPPSPRSRPTSSGVNTPAESERHNTQVVNLSKYTSIRDTNAALAEEMGASSLIQTSSTPPSRRLSNVPGLSTSSSSPSRTQPHVPYVRSRLSTHSIVEETLTSGSTASRDALADQPDMRQVDEEEEGEDEEDDDEPFIFQHDGV